MLQTISVRGGKVCIVKQKKTMQRDIIKIDEEKMQWLRALCAQSARKERYR
jgi:hypothetical protein